MSHQPAQLTDHLSVASWNHLVALLASHQLPRHARQTKSAFVALLAEHLTSIDTLIAIIAQLDGDAKEALRRLLAADGALPVHTFEDRFGPIRPYKPWRKDGGQGVAQPWLAPVSTTETLWYRGLIYRDPPKPRAGIYQHYVLPVDLIPHLKSLLEPALSLSPLPLTPVARLGLPPDLLVHLGAWLASPHRLEECAGIPYLIPYLIAYRYLHQAERVCHVDRMATVAFIPRPPADNAPPAGGSTAVTVIRRRLEGNRSLRSPMCIELRILLEKAPLLASP